VIIAGSTNEEVSRLREGLSVGDGNKEASCLGTTVVTGAVTAAFLNGVSGSSIEFEEGNTWAMGHPAIQIVPCLLAVSEKMGCSGKELLVGLVAGYETAGRLARAVSLRKGMHPTGTWGTVGAALGVGLVLHRTANELYEIANIAASFAISPYVKNSFVGMNVASTFAGVTNYFGVLSNMLYDSGFRADLGSFKITFSRFVSDRLLEESLCEALGEEYFIASNYFKPYPSCRFCHSPIDALRAILEQTPLNPEDIEHVIVGTFQAGMHCDAKTPPNEEAIRFSTPFLMAILILHGDIDLEIMRHVSIGDPVLKALAAKVEMELVPRYEEVRPGQNPTRVTVRLRNGRELSHEVMNAKGDKLYPMSESEIFAKFVSLGVPVIGSARIDAFIDRCGRIEGVRQIRELTGLLRAG
jgi:2-methylcitrate dehydratase PrpD